MTRLVNLLNPFVIHFIKKAAINDVKKPALIYRSTNKQFLKRGKLMKNQVDKTGLLKVFIEINVS